MDRKEEAKIVEKFWEQYADPKFAHLCENERGRGFFNKTTDNPNELGRYMFNVSRKYVDLKDKIVIDYGIGGGFIGRDLFQIFGIGRYIGIDVSNRSIQESGKILSPWGDKVVFKKPPVDFSTLGGDVFISFACIQHFPSVRYLNDFLRNLNGSRVRSLILQIRQNDKTEEKKGAYKRRRSMGKVCLTNEQYVTEKLSNYELQNTHPPQCTKGDYQYLIYFSKGS